MDVDYFDKYTFACEMYGEENELIKLILNFFPRDNSVQIIDVAKGRNLVRRMHMPPLKLYMLQIGNIVNILNRLIYIKDGAPLTMRTLYPNNERLIIDYVTSGEVIGLELVGPDAVKRWHECLGATDPADAEPGTLRKIYGKTILRNVAHGTDTPEEAKEILDEFFGIENGVHKTPYQATLKNCTCCIILPHAVIDGNLGPIVEYITTEEFFISAMAMVSVNNIAAKEFYEVYNGVVPKFKEMCMQLTQGKCVVCEVKHNDPKANPVCAFRKLCGPRDPDICRQLYPDTIRACFGKDLVQNAVHCTDLPEDGEMEVEYFFKLLVTEF